VCPICRVPLTKDFSIDKNPRPPSQRATPVPWPFFFGSVANSVQVEDSHRARLLRGSPPFYEDDINSYLLFAGMPGIGGRFMLGYYHGVVNDAYAVV